MLEAAIPRLLALVDDAHLAGEKYAEPPYSEVVRVEPAIEDVSRLALEFQLRGNARLRVRLPPNGHHQLLEAVRYFRHMKATFRSQAH